MQSPTVTFNLTCAQCRWETEVDLGEINWAFSYDSCEEHGSHTTILMVIKCSQCETENEIEIIH